MSDELWQDLVKNALLGTERQTFTPPQVDGPLGALLARLDSARPEHALLGAAAAVALYRRAGHVPPQGDQPLPAPCEPDDAARCNPRAAQRLRLMLEGQYPDLLSEWPAAVAQTGRRVPEEYLSALLSKGHAQANVCDAIVPVLGKRGKWLAAFNPDWDYALPIGDDEAAWQTSSRATRVSLLKRLRAGAPDRGRELLASTWATESPDDRAAFLATFEAGLSLADEPFLDAALDDKRKEVRRAAADLLRGLPQSRLCQRMTERVKSLVTFVPAQKGKVLKRGQKARLEVTLPDECDKAMQRDGVEPKPPHSKIGEKAWWLQQMLGATPLEVGCAAWKLSPAECIQAAGQGEWRSMLLAGWASAAASQRDADWIEALLTDLLRAGESIDMPQLFRALPRSRQEAFVLNILRQNPSLESDQPASWFLPACEHAWSDELSRAVLNSVYKHVRDKDIKTPWKWSELLQTIARRLNPARLPEVLSRLGKTAPDGGVTEQIEKFLALLQFRHDMLKEIAE